MPRASRQKFKYLIVIAVLVAGAFMLNATAEPSEYISADTQLSLGMQEVDENGDPVSDGAVATVAYVPVAPLSFGLEPLSVDFGLNPAYTTPASPPPVKCQAIGCWGPREPDPGFISICKSNPDPSYCKADGRAVYTTPSVKCSTTLTMKGIVGNVLVKIRAEPLSTNFEPQSYTTVVKAAKVADNTRGVVVDCPRFEWKAVPLEQFQAFDVVLTVHAEGVTKTGAPVIYDSQTIVKAAKAGISLVGEQLHEKITGQRNAKVITKTAKRQPKLR